MPPGLVGIAWMIAAATPSALSPEAARFQGIYDGRAMEMAAGLELRADGRFTYGLSYGALDEGAEGSWSVEAGRVLLTSDAFERPQFILAQQSDAPPGKLRLRLEVPEQLPVQLFDALVEDWAGEQPAEVHSLGSAEEELDYRAPASRLRLALPMFDVVSDPIDLAKGGTVHVTFRANNLGKVAFERTPLVPEGDALLLPRHGALVRFTRRTE